MPIRINCRHCGKRFSAWDDLVGKPAKCPKCHQQMIVPGGESEVLPPPSPPAETSSPVPPPPETSTPPPTASTPVPPPAVKRTSATSPSATSLPKPPRSNVAGPYHADDLDDNEELPFACPSCQEPMSPQEDLCDQCGYHRVLKRRIDVSSGINKPDKSTGFERVFRGQLYDAQDAESTLRFAKIVGAVAVLLVIFLCPPAGLVLAAGLVVGFLLHQQKRSKEGGDSAVNQDALSAFIWSLLLNCQRFLGWRTLAWPFPQTRALTLHDATFTDADLADLQNLSDYQTLDLQGTQISNEGLNFLAGMKQLQYLVVRDTNVTAGGVQKLQQALPHAWIWY